MYYDVVFAYVFVLVDIIFHLEIGVKCLGSDIWSKTL